MTIFRFVGMNTTVSLPAETAEKAYTALASLLMADEYFTTHDGLSLHIGDAVHPFTVTREEL